MDVTTNTSQKPPFFVSPLVCRLHDIQLLAPGLQDTHVSLPGSQKVGITQLPVVV